MSLKLKIDSARFSGAAVALHLAISLILTIAFCFLVAPFILNGQQRFPEFIGSFVAVSGVYKTGENFLFLTGYLVFALLSLLLLRIPLFKTNSTLNRSSSLWLVVSGLMLGISLVKGSALLLPVAVIAIICSGIGVSERFFAVASDILIAIVTALVCVLLLKSFSTALTSSVAMFATAGIITAFCLAPRLRKFGVWLQLLSPLLLIRFSHFLFVHPTLNFDQNLSSYGNLFLFGTILLLIFLGVKELRTGSRLLSITPACLAALLNFVTPLASPIQGDEYHLGEMLLPFQQIVQLGQKAYFEFVPTQGLLGLSYGAIHHFLLAPDLQGFGCTATILAAITTVVLSLTISRAYSPWLALLLAPITLPAMDRFYLFAISLLVLSEPKLWRNVTLWFATSALLCLLSFLWQPVTGVALGISVVAISLLRLRMLVSEVGAIRSIRTTLPAAAICIAGLLTLPIQGAVMFLFENAYTNTVAHGLQFLTSAPLNPLFPRYFSSDLHNRFVWEGIRVGGWMFGSTFILALLLSAFSSLYSENKLRLSFFALTILVACILLEPYVIGRVDPPSTLSRTGSLSFLILSLFLPFIFFSVSNTAPLHRVTVILFGFLLGVPLAVRSFSFEQLLSVPQLKIPVPEDHLLVDGRSEGLAHLGKFFAPVDKIEAVRELKSALANLISDEETFADFSNRISYHYLLNKKFPTIYASVAAVNSKQQFRMLRTLESKPPPVVLIHPLIPFEGVSASLRTYLVAKWFVKHNYKPVKINRFLFLVSPDRATSSDQSAEELWEKSWTTNQLEQLPASWGRGFSTLERLVERETVTFITSDSNQTTVANEAELSLTSRDQEREMRLESPLIGADFIELKLEIKGHKSVKTYLTWQGEGLNPLEVFSFLAANGRNIVPVGSNPKWLKQPIKTLNLRFKRTGGSSVAIESISALRLR